MDAETHSQIVDAARGLLLMEALEKGLRALERMGTPQDDQQSQLAWTLVAGSSVFMWVPQQLEQGLSLKLLPVCEICSSTWAALSDISGKGCA